MNVQAVIRPLFLTGVLLLPGVSWALDYSVHGYLRQYLSFNLEDKPEPDAGGGNIDGKWDLAIARSVVKLDFDASHGDIYFKAVGRFSREYESGYLDDLNDAADASFFGLGGEFFPDEYDEESLRELYVGMELPWNLDLVVGKQQVVWGQADFFRSTDIVHGYDYRWRSTLERENEEIRNPLWLFNLTLAFPDLDSSLQFIYRPGWDSGRNVVNNLDLFGGRFSAAGTRGVDNLNAAVGTPYDFDDPSGDTDDANYGFRWSSHLFDHALDYSLIYYRGLNRDPVVNSTAIPLVGGFPGAPVASFGSAPANGFGEIVFPFIDTFAATYTADFPAADLVLRGEFAYIPNLQYNVGSQFDAIVGAPVVIAPGPPPVLFFPSARIPGMGGVKEKETLRYMIGFDYTARWTERVFRTQRPGLITVEVFDRWILGYDRDDDIVETFGFGATAREHQPIFTGTLTLNYDYDRFIPSIALLYDMNFGDAILVPALDIDFGDHWRLYIEGSIVLPNHGVKESTAEIENDTHLLGLAGNNSQLLFRLSYQF